MRLEVIKKPDDPVCQRISLGGSEEHGYYLVYRGELKECQRMLALLGEVF